LDFLTTLEKIATESGVQSDITISDIPTGTDPIVVPVTITVSGPWPSILVQLRALEHLQPLVLVESVDVTGTNTANVSATLAAKTLWL
jgi:hypothetical protein